MSEQLSICLIAVAVNLIGMIVIYAAMSLFQARRSMAATVALIVTSQLFWIVPGVWIVEAKGASPAGAYALWLGNWLVAGFSIVLLGKTTALIPTALFDTARIDGLGGFAGWRRAVFPFVRRDLLLLALFTIMATLLPFWGVINQPDAGNVITIFKRSSTMAEHLGWMAAGSLAGAIPLIAILFLEGRALSRP